MVQALPGSLSEGAAERSEAEGVYFGERKRSKVSEFICAGGKSLAWRNHRGTLPQSRPLGVTAPSEREPGTVAGVRTIQCAARKPWGCGRFSSPLRKVFSIHWGILPQSRVRSTAPSEREPGMGRVPFNRVLAKPEGCGRFSSPLRRLRMFYILPFNWGCLKVGAKKCTSSL